jgi:protein-S-isoprenylcysteine O-methyltransferase Ste14
MPLREDFERSGNWLFRRRSYLPLPMIGCYLLGLRHYHYLGHSARLDHLWTGLCLAVSFFGLGIRAFTIGHAPKGTSGRNTRSQVADTLNTTGIYSIVRNPLYLGNFFVALGTTLFVHNGWLLLVYALSFWLYYERIIFAEEEFLRAKFGRQYLEWARRTPAFIPRFPLYRKPELAFSPRTVLRREYNGFFVVAMVMFLLEVGKDLDYSGNFAFDPGWFWYLGISFAVWVALRTLKKHSGLLNVEGR